MYMHVFILMWHTNISMYVHTPDTYSVSNKLKNYSLSYLVCDFLPSILMDLQLQHRHSSEQFGVPVD